MTLQICTVSLSTCHSLQWVCRIGLSPFFYTFWGLSNLIQFESKEVTGKNVKVKGIFM